MDGADRKSNAAHEMEPINGEQGVDFRNNILWDVILFENTKHSGIRAAGLRTEKGSTLCALKAGWFC